MLPMLNELINIVKVIFNNSIIVVPQRNALPRCGFLLKSWFPIQFLELKIFLDSLAFITLHKFIY